MKTAVVISSCLISFSAFALPQPPAEIPVYHWTCGAISSADMMQGSPVQPGRYSLPLVGGSGSGAVAAVTIGDAGLPTETRISPAGERYKIGDVLTADSLPGFKIVVDGVVNTPRDENGAQVINNNVHMRWPKYRCPD